MNLKSKILVKKNVERGEFEQALHAIDENLKFEPDDSYLNYYKAKILYSLNRNTEALVPLKKAIYFDSKNYEIAMLAADIFSSLKYYYKAEDFYKYILKNSPQNAVALANFACLKSMTGQDGEANYLIKKAIKIDPKNEIIAIAKYKVELIQKNMFDQAKTLDKIKTHMTGSDYKTIVDSINYIEDKKRTIVEDMLKNPEIKEEVAELLKTLLKIEKSKRIHSRDEIKINWKFQILMLFINTFCCLTLFHLKKYKELLIFSMLYLFFTGFSLIVINTRKRIRYNAIIKES